jgi:hypothetical protein
MAETLPKPYEWEWDGSCAPDRTQIFTHKTFSVGVFQWIPKSGKKRLKRSPVKCRIKGLSHDTEQVYEQVWAKCAKLNEQRLGYPEEV